MSRMIYYLSSGISSKPLWVSLKLTLSLRVSPSLPHFGSLIDRISSLYPMPCMSFRNPTPETHPKNNGPKTTKEEKGLIKMLSLINLSQPPLSHPQTVPTPPTPSHSPPPTSPS